MHSPAPAPPELAPASGALRFVSSLRHRDWRYLWSGLMAIQLGEWMDHTAINWLVLVETNSPLVLGLVNLVRGAPNIGLAVFGGVVADRLDRKVLLLWTQVASLVCTALLAALASGHTLELWHVYVLLTLRGIAQAFNHPARSSIIGDLVPRGDVTNAMALHSTTFNATRMIGPAIAGFLIASAGTAVVLWIHAATHLVGIWTLLEMKSPASIGRIRISAWGTLVDGFVYIRQQPVVFLLMVLGVLPFLLGQPYQAMLPVFAKDVFVIGPEGLGLLMTASATGAVAGAMAVSGLGAVRGKGLVMMGGIIGFGLLVVAFGITPWPVLGAVLLFLAGAAFQVYGTTNAALMMLTVPAEYRGRVLGLYQMDRGFIPVGSFVAGALAEIAGAPTTVALMGGLLTLLAILILGLSPRVRQLE